ncbi:MAG: hypothetical protein RMK32_06150 [Anaerolineae bacterium]|nr:hypothetical protein [Thermoflexus sp.]MDW8065195.1 hypothetical protein [Anaerolineae bacterium]
MSIEDFLIKEYEQQHQNIREIMMLTFQKVQFFLNLETFVLGALLTIFSFGIRNIADYLLFPALFLSLLGHTVFITSVHSIVQEIKLDHVNNIVRVYFRRKYSHQEGGKYIYFGRGFEDIYLRSNLSDSKNIPWRTHKDPSVFISLFVGNVNSVNITLTVLGVLIVLARLVNINVELPMLLGTGIPIAILIRKFYISRFFDRILDQEQDSFTREWSNYMNEIFR